MCNRDAIIDVEKEVASDSKTHTLEIKGEYGNKKSTGIIKMRWANRFCF